MIKTMFEHAKKHPGLIPQFFFLSLGITGATFYLIRLARGPHVTLWDKKNNPEPWNRLDPTYQYKLIPQFFFLSLGITGATFYLIRLARGPHVTLWDKKNNPEPWNRLDPTYQYKFVAVNTDYKNLKKDGPDF